VLGRTTVQVLVLEEGVPGTPVVGLPAVAVAALALGLSHTPDRLAAIDQPVARVLLAVLLLESNAGQSEISRSVWYSSQ
jgi:hypothetical protein